MKGGEEFGFPLSLSLISLLFESADKERRREGKDNPRAGERETRAIGDV
jgi:hypothetical protein